MCGECEKVNSYPICPDCTAIIYRRDGTCMLCLVEQSKNMMKKTDELLKRIGKDEL